MALILDYIKANAAPMEGANLAVLEDLLSQIDSGKLNFYEKTDPFKIELKLADFNLLQFDHHLYSKINLPFQVTVYNNTFMKTKIYRLVSRKLPNTINWFSNVQLPFDIEIGESRSFVIYVSIDDLDDLDQLIDNDLAFMFYSDNTTLAEIDFAIRVPDIRGITKYKKSQDTTLDLDDWYLQGILDFEDIITKVFKLDDDARVYSKLRDFQNFRDISADSTWGQEALDSVLKDIWDNNKLKDFEISYVPADFAQNVINIRNVKSFRDKFKFNIHKFTYFEGITDSTYNIGFDDAKSVWNNQKSANQSLINVNLNNTDMSTQKNNLSGIVFMMRIPYFGSQFMYYDAVFYVLNIRNKNVYIPEIEDMGKFVGDFIRLGEIYSEDPEIQDAIIKYDISSQVKENLTTFKSFYAPTYATTPDETVVLGYKVLGVDVSIDMSDIIDTTDITLSYYYTNPIVAYKKNQVVFEHSEQFREKMLAYDQTTYFGIDATELFPDNSIQLYTMDQTVQKQLYDTSTGDQTDTTTDWTISNNVGITISNKILNSFQIVSLKNVSNGESTLLLADTTKEIDIFYIDKIEIFNDGNTFLQISDVNMFLPNGRYDLADRFENEWGSDMIKQGQIENDGDFYKSLFDPETPVEVMSFNSLAPGETGDIYIVQRLNRDLINAFLTDFFKVPLFLRLEFNDSLSAYICNVPGKELRKLADYKLYIFGDGQKARVGHAFPFSQQMYNPQRREPAPADEQQSYAHVDTVWDHSNIYWKSKFHHDVAWFADATVASNKNVGEYVDLKNGEPYSGGVFREGKMYQINQMMTVPTPTNIGTLYKINDLISIYNMSLPTELEYRFYIMKFETFFEQFIQDIKDKFHLVSMMLSTWDTSHAETDYAIYFRYDLSNEYKWYNYQIEPISRSTQPFNMSQLSQFTAGVTIYIPESMKNTFQFTIPKPLEFVSLYTFSQNMFGTYLTGEVSPDEDLTNLLTGQMISEQSVREKTGQSRRQYFSDRFHSIFDFGEIVGNKQLTMSVSTEFMNLFKIKSFDNLEIGVQGVGPGVPDVYTMRIIKPELEYASIVFQFFKYDYTAEFKWEQKIVENIAQNSGNYMITPTYFDLEYLPIDETYSVMVKVTNQNPYQVSLSMLPVDSETSNTIQLIEFPENEDANKIYYYLKTLGRPYSMLPNEEVKMFFRIIPRRIGMNFFTIYLNINGSIRPINFEFRSFINRKAYFVLDSDSKTIDFGDVPIGKYSEEPIIVKNIGNVVGKVNSIYVFGNDSKQFKLLDRDSGGVISERLSYNKVVKPKQSLAIPIRFYSQEYGFNYSYAYIETNEPVLENAQQYESDETDTDMTQLYRNAPKYLVSLLKGNAVIEDEIIETDSYIFLGYVNPLTSKFRNYEVVVNNKNRNKIVSIFKVTNLMKNYVKVKYTREPFDKSSSLFIQLNPRAYTEGWYYDELFVWMIVYDKKTRTSKFVLNKIPVSQYVTREQRLSFDVDLEEIIFSTKPFLKAYRKINIRNYSNEDATLFTNLLNDHSGLFTLVPNLGAETMTIPEGIGFTLLMTFGGDQRFIGKYDTMLTLQLELGGETITKYIPVTGIVGDSNIVKFYKRTRILTS